MITPPGIPGVVFAARADGDGRSDGHARSVIGARMGMPGQWATIHQVHGSAVVYADAPGFYGEADGLITDVPMVPVAIATADCVPVVLLAQHARGVVHAGWRGLAAGVIHEAHRAMERRGHRVASAVVGPYIGPCCYEVGEEVVEAVGGFAARTRSGSLSLDLGAAVASQLADAGTIDVVDIGVCTFDDADLASYRQNRTTDRQVTVAWLPED